MLHGVQVILMLAALGSPFSGLLPIWENTGEVLRHRELFLGTSNIQFGIADLGHIGFNPNILAHKTPNLHGKVQIYRGDILHVALQAESFFLVYPSEETLYSSFFGSPIANRNHTLSIVPVSIASSIVLADWLILHRTVTAAIVFGNGPLRDGLTVGSNGILELRASPNHGLLIHVGDVGLWNHAYGYVGASYQLTYGWFSAEGGGFIRFDGVGRQSLPLLRIGVLL
jgi:hypothetical protein